MAVQRALDNLVGNAVRYGRHAWISLEAGKRSLTIRVEDDGPGIPEVERDQAVKAFARLDPARNQNLPGVGLGLSIAADIARSHGGQLRLGSSAAHGGLRADLVLAR
ncbi:ATP-binding protein [Mangrovicoccus ximenensis]|uniref:ATP-binding protein n=1 Tax=Mangrovicoccus ximenensis TaxID=1911570 RepID=UPI002ED0A861